MGNTGSTGTRRRAFLGHCSVALAAGTLALAMPLDAAAQGSRRLLVVGDSLSAEYGLARGTGWVALLDARLKREAPGVTVVNASISGDTTSGGLARLPPLLRDHKPDLVIIELGANDALRGLPIEQTRDNLAQMTRLAKAAGARVVLVGMQLPPNFGKAYGDRFAGLYAELAKAEGTSLVPFMLKGVADLADPTALFQRDRIHPTAEAHPIILGNIWPVLQPLLR